MPNWCENEVRITSCDIEKLKGDLIIENGVIKLPSSKVVSDRSFDNVNWYNDNINDLGVKWHFEMIVKAKSIEEITSEEITLFVDTAWSYPDQFINTFAKTYNVTGQWNYSEGGMWFAGYFWLDNGDIMQHVELDYDDELNILRDVEWLEEMKAEAKEQE